MQDEMFGFIKKMSVRILTVRAIGILGELLASNSKERLKCISLNNPSCLGRLTFVDINSNETNNLIIYLLVVLISVV